MRKKILSLVLAIAMMCAFVPCMVSAETSGTCGEDLTWVLDEDGTLTISGTGDMKEYRVPVKFPWCNSKDDITSVVIDDGVTSIADYAFNGYTNITSLTIGNSIESIGVSSFFGCAGLKSLVIPDSVIYIGASAFGGCSGLECLSLSGSVTTIDALAFNGCNSLKTLVIPDGVAEIGKFAFGGCTGLTEITIPANVTSIGSSVFESCGNLLINVDKNNPAYSSVDGVLFNKSQSELVAYAKDMAEPEYVIPDGVTEIAEGAFSGCTGLTSITIPTSVTKIGSYAFDWCNNLSEVYYAGNSEDWQNIKIGEENTFLIDAVVSCYGIEYIPETVRVVLDGTALTFDYPPVVIDGRTLVPLRKIIESIGATIEWEEETQTIILACNGVTITFTIGSNIMYKDGTAVELDVPAQLIDGHTMVPVRAIAESFGAEVGWDESTSTVTIVTE